MFQRRVPTQEKPQEQKAKRIARPVRVQQENTKREITPREALISIGTENAPENIDTSNTKWVDGLKQLPPPNDWVLTWNPGSNKVGMMKGWALKITLENRKFVEEKNKHLFDRWWAPFPVPPGRKMYELS